MDDRVAAVKERRAARLDLHVAAVENERLQLPLKSPAGMTPSAWVSSRRVHVLSTRKEAI
jgi:hypothetical protein